MGKTLLRPGWVVTHLLVLAIAVAFVSLGLWQVRRHGEQQRENERIVQQLAADPVPVEEGLAQPDPDLLPVHATGTYAQGADVTLSPRSRNERPGFEVLTPLRLSDGATVLVNRGWMPLDSPIPPVPTGEVTVDGRLRTPRSARRVLTDDAGAVTLLSSVDLELLSSQVEDLRTAAFIEHTDEAARQAGALPRPADPVTPDAGPHLSYAAQWFAFTVIGLVGYPLLLRRRLADAAGRSDGPATGGSDPRDAADRAPTDRAPAPAGAPPGAPVASSDPT